MAAAQFVGWSSSFVDYDNDGDVDIFKTNGALKHLYGQEDQIFQNDGGRKIQRCITGARKIFSKGIGWTREHVWVIMTMMVILIFLL